MTALIALGVGIARLWPGTRGGRSADRQRFPGAPWQRSRTFVAEALTKASAVVSVARIVWHALVQPLVGYVLVLVLVMCAACATFGAALGRVALGGVPQT